jgi:hypothetical protein
VTRELGEHLQVGPLIGIGPLARDPVDLVAAEHFCFVLKQHQVDVARARLLAHITAVEDNRRVRCPASTPLAGSSALHNGAERIRASRATWIRSSRSTIGGCLTTIR